MNDFLFKIFNKFRKFPLIPFEEIVKDYRINNLYRTALINRITDKCIVDNDGCWIWQGSTSGRGNGAGRGYGKIRVQGVSSLVHRVMYICIYGYIPNKITVDHKCRKRLCCNPEHLEAVTHKENCKRRNKK